MTEDKREIVSGLMDLLTITRAGQDILGMEYEANEDWEYAVVYYKDGSTRRIDITADSGIAMIYDIAEALIYFGRLR